MCYGHVVVRSSGIMQAFEAFPFPIPVLFIDVFATFLFRVAPRVSTLIIISYQIVLSNRARAVMIL